MKIKEAKGLFFQITPVAIWVLISPFMKWTWIGRDIFDGSHVLRLADFRVYDVFGSTMRSFVLASVSQQENVLFC